MLVKAYSFAVWSVLVKQERRDAEKSGAEKERRAVEDGEGGTSGDCLNARWNSLAGTDKERQSCDRRIKAPVLKDEFINRLQEVLERKTMAGIQGCVRLLQKSWGKVTRSEKDLRLRGGWEIMLRAVSKG